MMGHDGILLSPERRRQDSHWPNKTPQRPVGCSISLNMLRLELQSGGFIITVPC